MTNERIGFAVQRLMELQVGGVAQQHSFTSH